MPPLTYTNTALLIYIFQLLTFFSIFFFFFFNDTATTEIYTLSLHDALPIFLCSPNWWRWRRTSTSPRAMTSPTLRSRSEEHTSELQSRLHLVCRLLLEKKKNIKIPLRRNNDSPHQRGSDRKHYTKRNNSATA